MSRTLHDFVSRMQPGVVDAWVAKLRQPGLKRGRRHMAVWDLQVGDFDLADPTVNNTDNWRFCALGVLRLSQGRQPTQIVQEGYGAIRDALGLSVVTASAREMDLGYELLGVVWALNDDTPTTFPEMADMIEAAR